MIKDKNVQLLKALGERIKELRTSIGLSQEQLCNEADVPLSQIGRIERGEINPTISSLNKICEALKIDLKMFFDFKYD